MSERTGIRSGAYAELLGGTFLVAFAVLSATGVGRFSLPGLPPTSAPFLLVPFGCLSVGAIVRARSFRRRSAAWAFAWVLAGGFLIATASLTFLSLSLLGLPRGGFVYGFALGGVIATLGSVSLGAVGLSGAIQERRAVLFFGWPLLAAITLGAFVLLDVGTVVSAATLPLGVAWLLIADVGRVRPETAPA